MDAAQPAPVGQTLNSYKVYEKLGAGGMGVVYKALDTKLQRTVALKFLPHDPDSRGDFRSRLIAEARAASVLDHPNIGTIYGVEEAPGGQMFIVMAFYEGQTLAKKIDHGLTQSAAVAIALQIAAGLEEAHAHHVVHRDIKPSNVILTPQGVAKIVDFGLARVLSSASATRSLNTAGTAAYMSPEQALEREGVDHRTDLWSLGVTLYEMLTGSLPFAADSLPATLLAIVQSPPRQMGNEVPPELQRIVYRALAKDREARYQSAAEMIEDLNRAAPSAGQVAKPAATTLDISRYRRLASRSAVSLKPATTNRPAAKWLFGALTVAVLLGLSLTIPAVRRQILSGQKNAPGAMSLPQKKVLAVLPFQSQDGNLASLGNGLVETLTAKLARVGGDHSLQVVSSSELRARHVTRLDEARQEYGATLGLLIVLQKSGNLLHVAYSILDARTGASFFGDSLDSPSGDLFAMEDKVAGAVASALALELRPEEKRELVEHGTASPEAYNYYLQARGYMDQGPESMDMAIILLTRALAADAGYGLAQAELGTAYWSKYVTSKDKSFVGKARQACSRAVDLGNAGAEGHVCLGVLQNGTGEYEKAVDEFTRAIQLDSSLDEAYVGLGFAYERLGKLNDAEKTYQQVISLRPQYWRGYNLLGIFYCRQSQYAQCAAMFQKVADLTPESFRGYANLGAADLAAGRYEQAIAPLEQSLRIRATPATYGNLGTAYFHLRRFDDAARTYADAAALNDRDHVMWGNLGEAQYFAGQRTEAAGSYRKAIMLAEEALKVNPRDPEVLSRVASYHAMLGERAPALKYLNQALVFGKSDQEILFTAALIYNHLGETGPALEWLRKALHAGYSLTTVRESPDLDNLRADARYKALVENKND
ncbi:MAG TPA: protein kinase [Candidatus Angelobacter sp.]|nr:protein kinase [Candidatus Angelobacter sp.]